MATETITTRCAIAGGGPAGMMLGFLLARAGVEVVVLEKHGDFLRDFRGDTIHPSALEVIYELGLLDEFLKRPHQKVDELRALIGNDVVFLADLKHLPTHCSSSRSCRNGISSISWSIMPNAIKVSVCACAPT
jgi:2-polyprenyl-6-methoxyphenol hydroxylase-like FAD-dependent oxidoreductase